MFYVEPVAGDPPVITVSTNLDTLHSPQVNDSLEVEYLVEIIAPGYEAAERRVTILSGQEQKVDLKLNAIPPSPWADTGQDEKNDP